MPAVEELDEATTAMLHEWASSPYSKPMRNYILSLDDEDKISICDSPMLSAGLIKKALRAQKKRRK